MQENHVRVCADDPSQIARCSQPIKVFNKMQHIIIHSHQDAKKLLEKLPLSCFRRLALLQILTVHTERIMATMKNRIPPISPAVTARVFTFSGRSYFNDSLMLYPSTECDHTRKSMLFEVPIFFTAKKQKRYFTMHNQGIIILYSYPRDTKKTYSYMKLHRDLFENQSVFAMYLPVSSKWS